ncbi:unnamed protein product [Blepharisma stoltei]|uniref:HEPN domain-containing protein n=1 Tax=Blepharisma stoltei TaxID=1481888 RepID=A0AAU9JW68_9CILI|nr:unnamed protein product [Blepharisma stoltei]
MDDKSIDLRGSQIEKLMDIKQKASEIKHALEGIRLDGTMKWSDILRIYSLAAANLHYLQGKLTSALDHIVIVPDFNTHEDPEYIPNIISSWLLDEVDSAQKQAIQVYSNNARIPNDAEEMAYHFNSFCHELRERLNSKII